MNVKKVIACDLDGTLTESKSKLNPEMAEVICGVLKRHYMAVVSGGAFAQYQKQFLSELHCDDDNLKNLFLFPTNGSTCFKYENNTWQRVYNEPLSKEEKEKIIFSLNEAIRESKIDLTGAYGEIIEDRDSQITFSGRGQQAPMDVKKIWDPTREKRKSVVDILKNKIPEFEIRINSVSSIDITRKGIDKAYAIMKIRELLNVTDEDIIYIGDALYEWGNDAAVKKTDVDYIQKSGPDETIELLREYL